MIENANDVIRVEAGELRTIARQAIEAAGVPADEAADAGDILWIAELMGITTHGLRRIITYVQRIHDGAINPRPKINVEQTAPSLSLVNGDNGLGPVVGSYGVREAIRLAEETGTGYVACRQSHHFGPVAPYALRAVEKGLVAFMGTNAEPVMAPWLGREVAHGNNPIAIAAPRRNGPPFILDIAQSIVAFSKLRHANEAGEAIPDNWASDKLGRPTTDPAAGLDGWVMPIGEHKGYGLAMAVEILAAAMSGGAVAREVNSLYRRDTQVQGVSHFFFVIDPDRMIGREIFLDKVDALCSVMSGTQPIDQNDPVKIPGEPEADLMRRYSVEGIPILRGRYSELQSLARGEPPQSMPPR